MSNDDALLLADMHAAHEALDDDMKARLCGLTAARDWSFARHEWHMRDAVAGRGEGARQVGATERRISRAPAPAAPTRISSRQIAERAPASPRLVGRRWHMARVRRLPSAVNVVYWGYIPRRAWVVDSVIDSL